ncbi:MAG: DUF1826 domain-containing protein [Pseudomonadota bacterium]
MNLVRETVVDAAIGVGVADRCDDLAAINHPGCAAAIWRRQLDRDFQTWVDSLQPDELPRARMILPPEEAAACLLDLFDEQHVQAGDERAWLVGDIQRLCTAFLRLVHAPFIRLRLDVVANNACRKFHLDAVTARLVCTYRGTGTQYGVSTDGADPRRIFTVATGSPIILRGTQWPETPRSGLLHRSPPIEGTGETRFVLVIDPIFDPDEEC